MAVNETPSWPLLTSAPPPTFYDLDGHRHRVPPQSFPHLSKVALAQLPPQGEFPARALPAVPLGGGLQNGHCTLGPASRVGPPGGAHTTSWCPPRSAGRRGASRTRCSTTCVALGPQAVRCFFPLLNVHWGHKACGASSALPLLRANVCKGGDFWRLHEILGIRVMIHSSSDLKRGFFPFPPINKNE